MYSLLSTALTTEGVRGSVGIVGPETTWIDLFGRNVKTHGLNPTTSAPQQYGQVLDAVAFHDYGSVFDYDVRAWVDSREWVSISHTMDTLNEIKTSVNGTYSSNGKATPSYFITECVNSLYSSAYTNEKSCVSDAWLLFAEQGIFQRALTAYADGT